MATAAARDEGGEDAHGDDVEKSNRLRLAVVRAARRPAARELLVFVAFLFLTALMTWPWVTRLRDAVADPGDPYLTAWTMWWDYHQTFNDPLNLFHANIFYPVPYTLAFSEHDYGVAVLFFPLFAAGLRPLTVHSVATFFGFAFCGYGAFRLARTLTGSTGAAWVAGVAFAFTPYRFHVLSQLHYLFAGWIPLLLEALVLFARERSWKRAAWLGVAFVMNALTCLSWFILTLVPLALSTLFLVVRSGLARDRAFWLRGAAAMFVASLALLPFMLPYYYVSKIYNFTWSPEIARQNSPRAMHWLVSDRRNQLWNGLGENFPESHNRLFPGLLTLLLSLAAVLIVEPVRRRFSAAHKDATDAHAAGGATEEGFADEDAAEERAAEGSKTGDADEGAAVRRDADSRARLVVLLDALTVVALAVAVVAGGFTGSEARVFGVEVFKVVTGDRALFAAALFIAARLALRYPAGLRRASGYASLIDNVRASRRGEAFWLGSIWAVAGFLMSLGMNFFAYRVLFDFVFLFRGMRVPSRAAMLACVGLSVLAGLGASRLARWVALRRPRFKEATVMALVVFALLFELRAAPLEFVRGAVYPDALTLRLKETPMRGGLVELPTGGGGLPHLYMLRAADHGRPLINAISTFVPKQAAEINDLSHASPIKPRLLDLMEEIPASYLVVHNTLLAPERRQDYEIFLARAVASGRLRFIRRYGEGDDLYAVTKTEPEARSEEPPPFEGTVEEWSALIGKDTLNLLGQYEEWGHLVYRLHVAAYGRMPRFDEYLTDVRRVGRGALVGALVDPAGQESLLEENALRLAAEWAERPQFAGAHAGETNEQYVDALLANAGIADDTAERASLVGVLNAGGTTRAGVLYHVAKNADFAARERPRSFVLLHYFAYLRRNPGDPPDNNMEGFDYWVGELERTGDYVRVGNAFSYSIEYWRLTKFGRRDPI